MGMGQGAAGAMPMKKVITGHYGDHPSPDTVLNALPPASNLNDWDVVSVVNLDNPQQVMVLMFYKGNWYALPLYPLTTQPVKGIQPAESPTSDVTAR